MRNFDRTVTERMAKAVRDTQRVTGYTHNFYRYPARFSPRFAAEAVECFSKPGDLIIDPYMGGGTTIVEAMVRGRHVVGCDLNSLAVFISDVKTTTLTLRETEEVRRWATTIVPYISYRDMDSRLEHVLCQSRTRNMNLPIARPIKKFLALALISLEMFSSIHAENYARCVLLNVSQWALNGRRRHVSLTEFRDHITKCALRMLDASDSLTRLPNKSNVDLISPTLIHDSAENIGTYKPFKLGQRADLVITSPPYPGVHMLYHRWQIDGRKETPAPYWIADCLDGKGEAFYNFGTRHDSRMNDYFGQSLRTLQGVRSAMKDGAVIVQMVAFSNPRPQLKRYLDNMAKAGFCEVRAGTGRPMRVWRNVPGRRWHATLQGKTSSAREVALVHAAV